jgi:hypothetical protein
MVSGGSAEEHRAELERAAYSPDASPEQARLALARLQAWDAAASFPSSPPSAPSSPPSPFSSASVASRPVGLVPRPRAPRRRIALLAGIAVLLVAGGLAAGIQLAQHSAATISATALSRAEADSDLGRALARPQQPSDLPLGYQSGSGSAYPGDSYRLLFDGQPRAGSAVLRWRVWVGQGIDADHLCLVAAYDSSRGVSTCLPRAEMLTSTVTLTSPVGVQPLSVAITAGRVVVDVG